MCEHIEYYEDGPCGYCDAEAAAQADEEEFEALVEAVKSAILEKESDARPHTGT